MGNTSIGLIITMGADAPIPPKTMNATAVQDFLKKIFSTAFGCPRRGAPAAVLMSKW
jgi:hypothetical protein